MCAGPVVALAVGRSGASGGGRVVLARTPGRSCPERLSSLARSTPGRSRRRRARRTPRGTSATAAGSWSAAPATTRRWRARARPGRAPTARRRRRRRRARAARRRGCARSWPRPSPCRRRAGPRWSGARRAGRTRAGALDQLRGRRRTPRSTRRPDRAVAQQHGEQAVDHGVRAPRADGAVEVVLVGEVAVEHRLAHAGGRGDLGDARRGRARRWRPRRRRPARRVGPPDARPSGSCVGRLVASGP